MLMKIIIVEDEKLAVSRLQLLLNQLSIDYKIVAVANSVVDAVEAIKSNTIDLGFFDVQIEDGISLEIFELVNVNFPVIFTTAFNEYAVKAFKFNSIDYLLKPISSDELNNAIGKYKNIWKKNTDNLNGDVINEMRQLLKGDFKERFTIKTGNKMEVLKANNISFFYSYNKGTFVKTVDNRDLLIDSPLDLIFPLIDPSKFFRISRKFIVNIDCIIDIYAYSNSRLRVNMENSNNIELIVSREKVVAFKNWLEK